MRIQGDAGRVLVGHQIAAWLGRWTLTQVQDAPRPAYQITAAVREGNTFWLQQRPLRLELTMGQRAWRWDPIDPIVSAESLTATLVGAPSIH